MSTHLLDASAKQSPAWDCVDELVSHVRARSITSVTASWWQATWPRCAEMAQGRSDSAPPSQKVALTRYLTSSLCLRAEESPTSMGTPVFDEVHDRGSTHVD